MYGTPLTRQHGAPTDDVPPLDAEVLCVLRDFRQQSQIVERVRTRPLGEPGYFEAPVIQIDLRIGDEIGVHGEALDWRQLALSGRL